MENKNDNLEKKQVNVYIDNKQYTLLTNEDEEYIKGVSKYINNKINEISAHTNGISKFQNSFYIWLCLNIADDLFKHRQLSLKNKNSFEGDIEKFNLHNNNLKENLKNLEKEIDSLKHELKIEKNKVESLKVSTEENIKLKEDIENIKSENIFLKDQLESIENESSYLKEKLKNYETHINHDQNESNLDSIEILTKENEILKKGFDKFSEKLNSKISTSEESDDLNEVVSLHNMIVLSIAKKLERLRGLHKED